jgi:hypothetical protein
VSVRQNLEIAEGNDQLLRFTPQLEAPAEGITGWSLTFAVKKQYQDTTPLFTAPGTIVDAAAGIFTVPLTAAQTMQPPGKYVWDVRRTDAGFEWTLAEGYLEIMPGVLR